MSRVQLKKLPITVSLAKKRLKKKGLRLKVDKASQEILMRTPVLFASQANILYYWCYAEKDYITTSLNKTDPIPKCLKV